jgi:hypothetical protein
MVPVDRFQIDFARLFTKLYFLQHLPIRSTTSTSSDNDEIASKFLVPVRYRWYRCNIQLHVISSDQDLTCTHAHTLASSLRYSSARSTHP